jgi:hypothetical protein
MLIRQIANGFSGQQSGISFPFARQRNIRLVEKPVGTPQNIPKG